MVVVNKKERICKIFDFAVPGDSKIEEKEKDKIEKYQELGRELQKIWNVKVKIILLVGPGRFSGIARNHGNDENFHKSHQMLNQTKRYINKSCLGKIRHNKKVRVKFFLNSGFVINSYDKKQHGNAENQGKAF